MLLTAWIPVIFVARTFPIKNDVILMPDIKYQSGFNNNIPLSTKDIFIFYLVEK